MLYALRVLRFYGLADVGRQVVFRAIVVSRLHRRSQGCTRGLGARAPTRAEKKIWGLNLQEKV